MVRMLSFGSLQNSKGFSPGTERLVSSIVCWSAAKRKDLDATRVERNSGAKV